MSIIKGKKRQLGLHRHHKIPLHAGGEDNEENIVLLTREEHIAAHQKRYEEFGEDADRRAVILLQHGYYKGIKIIQTEWCKQAALASHQKKTQNGFYNRLGEMNSKRLKGKYQPHFNSIDATRDSKWYNNGNKNIRSKVNPGDGWSLGRINYER